MTQCLPAVFHRHGLTSIVGDDKDIAIIEASLEGTDRTVARLRETISKLKDEVEDLKERLETRSVWRP